MKGCLINVNVGLNLKRATAVEAKQLFLKITVIDTSLALKEVARCDLMGLRWSSIRVDRNQVQVGYNYGNFMKHI